MKKQGKDSAATEQSQGAQGPMVMVGGQMLPLRWDTEHDRNFVVAIIEDAPRKLYVIRGGGFAEKPDNIGSGAYVCDGAMVLDDAQLEYDAFITGDVIVSGKARVLRGVKLIGNAVPAVSPNRHRIRVGGQSTIVGNITISGKDVLIDKGAYLKCDEPGTLLLAGDYVHITEGARIDIQHGGKGEILVGRFLMEGNSEIAAYDLKVWGAGAVTMGDGNPKVVRKCILHAPKINSEVALRGDRCCVGGDDVTLSGDNILIHNGTVNDYAGVYDRAQVLSNGLVTRHARIYNGVQVRDNGTVTGHAEAYGDVVISGAVGGWAKVSGHTEVYGTVAGWAKVGGYYMVKYGKGLFLGTHFKVCPDKKE